MEKELYLKYPSLDDEEEWIEYTSEYFDKNSSCVVSGFKNGDSYKEWLKIRDNERNRERFQEKFPLSASVRLRAQVRAWSHRQGPS